ncbi:MAG: carbohydrate-binding domain-containing protein [Lachnospiraceae bacterium]|nr:carbohydrate-binding domain-containing protein [Lachnospiraceae bacterium]
MSTNKKINIICIIVTVVTVVIAGLCVFGKKLGITAVSTESDAKEETSSYVTNKDLDYDWDDSKATLITLSGSEATIKGDGAYVAYGDLYIKKGGYYVLSGNAEDLSVIVETDESSKVWIKLDLVDITCADDACIKVKEADKVFLTIPEGSESSLTVTGEYSDEASEEGVDGVIYAKDNLTINGTGSLYVNSSSAHGIVANDKLTLSGVSLNIDAKEDGIHTNGNVTVNDASITINAGDDGITSEKEVILASGDINIEKAKEGIEGFGITVVDAKVSVSFTDDGFNATSKDSETDDCFIRISGGSVKLISESGADVDGLDSNKDIYIEGGTVFVSLNGQGTNNAIDYGSENGGKLVITGGTVIAAGSSQMIESADASSTQASILYAPGTMISSGELVLKDTKENILIDEQIPCDFSAILLSTPSLKVGETYTLSIGDVTEEITVDSINTTVGNLKGGMQGPGGFGGKEGFDGGERPERPEGLNEGERPELPEDFKEGEMPTPPEGFDPENMPAPPSRDFKPEDRRVAE